MNRVPHGLRLLPSPEILDTEWKESSHPHIKNPVHQTPLQIFCSKSTKMIELGNSREPVSFNGVLTRSERLG